MDTTELLIERCKAAIQHDSDYRLAKVLNVSHTTLLHWRNGRTRPDDAAIIQMSRLIGVDPCRLIARMHFERAKCAETRAVWLRIEDMLPRVSNMAVDRQLPLSD
jgi:transcriptional regulator with XRE-family HTH domain